VFSICAFTSKGSAILLSKSLGSGRGFSFCWESTDVEDFFNESSMTDYHKNYKGMMKDRMGVGPPSQQDFNERFVRL
jgi:hypothetical protein